ncbi:MAG: hypothetical protein ACOX45_09330 [Acutalibacteraceae bacterium]
MWNWSRGISRRNRKYAQCSGEEKRKTAQLQERLDEELSKGTKAGLARQLADALRDAEDARAELRAMKRLPADVTGEVETVAPSADSARGALPVREVINSLPRQKQRNLGKCWWH